jgi:proton-coupled amino acid transporter
MAQQQRKAVSVPLLEPSSSTGTASTAQTLGNIIVSVVGTGVLGLPFAFRVAGWLAGLLGVFIAAVSSYYCMLLLVSSFFSFFLSFFLFSYFPYADLD